MRPGPALRAWLDDPVSRAETAARNRRFAADVRDGGRLAGFARELDAIDAAGGAPGATSGAVRRLLDDADWAAALIAAALAEAAADPFFEPPFAALASGARAGLVLLDHPLAVVTAAVMTPASFASARVVPGPRSITFTGAPSFTRFVRAGGARLAFHAAPDPGGRFRAATAPACRRIARRTIRDGEIVAIDGLTESFAVEAIAAPVLTVAGELRAPPGTLAREHDAATFAFIGASAADDACSRSGLMLSLLRVLGRRDAADLFARTIPNAPFFLRWQAMREYLALDASAALPALADMAAADPHEEVRGAAARTLAILRVRHPALFDPRRRDLAA